MAVLRGRKETVTAVPVTAAKPTVAGLGIDPAAQAWQRSGRGDGAIEIAFACAGDPASEWVLMRVAGDAERRVLVFDRNEWECFLDGVRNGEFEGAVAPARPREP